MEVKLPALDRILSQSPYCYMPISCIEYLLKVTVKVGTARPEQPLLPGY